MSDEEDDNVKQVSFGDVDKTLAQIEKMKRELPKYIEMAEIVAQIRKANFDALIKQGFTEAQALELIKTSN